MTLHKFNERNKVLDDLDIKDYTDELGDPKLGIHLV